ncbi:GntR family transcriptional regulator [Pseudonocardia humida]|uniref:GntR family transcriptional regulator n=1 Tax=Pseudonocardia humida TaxID=2800819 RepID=A0ABT1A7F0_9PSEU|nr:GntR family transcriptional regulator [Pseudonocardia humida]MCO1658947.1 GntR family transcriptional regulator [Pseudonocardia humida]
MSSNEEGERPYQRVAAAIRHRITTGALRPGDRVPSTRQLVRDFAVAMATATRALAVLRDEGLVVTRPGSGTVVRAPDPPARRAGRTPDRALTTARIVDTALAIADAEGLDAASMRRLAAELGVGPMSLYRHLSGREELEHLLVRAVFRAHPLPDPGPPGWRARLELVCRLEWAAFRRHPWLPELVSLTRPLLVPEVMAHTEWMLQALDGLALTSTEKAREVLALPALVRGIALSAAAEVRAERETGVANDEWWTVLDDEVQARMSSGRFPRLAALPMEPAQDFDRLLEHSLTRHLDGLAARLGRGRAGP